MSARILCPRLLLRQMWAVSPGSQWLYDPHLTKSRGKGDWSSSSCQLCETFPRKTATDIYLPQTESQWQTKQTTACIQVGDPVNISGLPTGAWMGDSKAAVPLKSAAGSEWQLRKAAVSALCKLVGYLTGQRVSSARNYFFCCCCSCKLRKWPCETCEFQLSWTWVIYFLRLMSFPPPSQRKCLN